MEWLQAADNELDRLRDPHRDKKRATILALVDARLAGRSEETVWGRPDTCSRNTYHTKWKLDPVFAEVLLRVTALARQWQEGRTLRALAAAAERLALAAPVAVARLVERMSSADEAIVLRAAVAILDRAGVETAAKSSSRTQVELDWSKLTDEQVAAVAAGTMSEAELAGLAGMVDR